MSFTMWATVVLFQSSYFYCNLKSVKSIIFPLNFPFKLSAIVVLCQSNLHFFMLFYQFNISRQVVVLYPHIFHSFPQLTKLFHWRESMWLKSIWNKIVLQNFRWCSVSFIIFKSLFLRSVSVIGWLAVRFIYRVCPFDPFWAFIYFHGGNAKRGLMLCLSSHFYY